MDDVRPPGDPAVVPPGTPVRRPGGQFRPVDPAAATRWLAENQAALDAFARSHEENGSPLDEYRQF